MVLYWVLGFRREHGRKKIPALLNLHFRGDDRKEVHCIVWVIFAMQNIKEGKMEKEFRRM